MGLRTLFSDESDSLQARNKLKALHQGSWPVSRYNSEFRTHLLHVHPPPSEDEKLEKYYDGLDPEIIKHIAPQNLHTLDEVMLAANNLDQIWHAHKLNSPRRPTPPFNPYSPRGPPSNFTPHPPPRPPGTPFQPPPRDTTQRALFQTPSTPRTPFGPARAAPPATPMSLGAVSKLTLEERDACIREGRCLRCRQPGHIARMCPNFSDALHVNALAQADAQYEEEPGSERDVNEGKEEEEINSPYQYISSLFCSAPNHLLLTKGNFAGHAAKILIDPGAQGNFINSSFVRRNRLRAHLKREPLAIGLALGLGLVNCTHDLFGSLALSDTYSTHISFDVLPLNFDIILGLSWLRTVKPQFAWDDDELIFNHNGREIRVDASLAHRGTSPSTLNSDISSSSFSRLGLRTPPLPFRPLCIRYSPPSLGKVSSCISTTSSSTVAPRKNI